jgi:hypothetical protein
MTIETIKIKFLEEFITLQDESVIRKLYETLQAEKQLQKPSLSDFAGMWSGEEAAQIQQATEECRTIDTNEW